MKKLLIFLDVLCLFVLYSSQSVPKGALIAVNFTGEVGFMLDEIPDRGETKKAVESYILKYVTDQEWMELAKFQIFLTIYRQVSRRFRYKTKMQLTLPPEQVWKINLISSPTKKVFHGHNYISRAYQFYSVLVTSASSVNNSEPALEKINGTYSDYFIVPVDVEQVFQRTGYACMNEMSYTKDTVISRNVHYYFDFGCKAEPLIPEKNRTYQLNKVRCHWTAFPNESCIEALEKYVGYTYLNITWTRLPWSNIEAAKWRYGEQSSQYADLIGDIQALKNEINVGYKYFDENHCALREASPKFEKGKGCIKTPGWKQLLRFTSTVINIGKTDLYYGNVSDPIYLKKGVFDFDPCHLHYHLKYYGTYSYGRDPGRKVGFCLTTTWRFQNNEQTSLNTPFTCQYQGISSGWGDDYNSGLDCQWVDVTGRKPGNFKLKVHINFLNAMCEGLPILDAKGHKRFVPMNYTSDVNETVYREDCRFTKNFDKNNINIITYNYTGIGSDVVFPCHMKAQFSPKKDCGFRLLYDNLKCSPGKTTSIKLAKVDSANDTIIRICESCVELGHSTFCEYQLSLANEVYIGTTDPFINIKFKCPEKRSNSEPGGSYSVLVSTIIPNENVPKLKIL